MGQEGRGPARRRLRFQFRCLLEVTRGEARKRGQRAKPARKTMAGKLVNLLRRPEMRNPTLSCRLSASKKPTGGAQHRVSCTEQLPCKCEQPRPSRSDPLDIRLLIENGGPAIFERR